MADNKTSREIRELSLLFDISTKLSEGLDLKAVLKPILQMTAEHMGILRGTSDNPEQKPGRDCHRRVIRASP